MSDQTRISQKVWSVPSEAVKDPDLEGTIDMYLPASWGNPDSFWGADVKVLASNPESAKRKVSESEYPVEPIEKAEPRLASDVIQS